MLFAHVAGFAAINCFGDLQKAMEIELSGWEDEFTKIYGEFMDISLTEGKICFLYSQIDFHDE
jgi:hypothetical protein